MVRWLFCFWLFPSVLAPHSTVGRVYYFDGYREVAATLLQQGEFRFGPQGPYMLHRPPGYALFVALCDPADPRRCYLIVQFLHGLLGALAVWLTMAAGEAWGLGKRGMLLAGWVVALWPFSIWETKVTVPETLLAALFAALLYAVKGLGSSATRALVVGLLAAALTLSHPLYQVLIIPLLGLALVRRRALVIACLLLGFALPVSVWIARNARLGYRGVATGFGYHYLKGVYEFELLLSGGPYFRDNDPAAAEYADAVAKRAGLSGIITDAERSDPAINHALDRLAIEHLRSHPFAMMAKTAVMLPLGWIHQQSPSRSALTAILLLPLVLLAFRSRGLGVIAVLILSVSLAAAAVFVQAIPMRYALPQIAGLALLAGAGWNSKHHEPMNVLPKARCAS